MAGIGSIEGKPKDCARQVVPRVLLDMLAGIAGEVGAGVVRGNFARSSSHSSSLAFVTPKCSGNIYAICQELHAICRPEIVERHMLFCQSRTTYQAGETYP